MDLQKIASSDDDIIDGIHNFRGNNYEIWKLFQNYFEHLSTRKKSRELRPCIWPIVYVAENFKLKFWESLLETERRLKYY